MEACQAGASSTPTRIFRRSSTRTRRRRPCVIRGSSRSTGRWRRCSGSSRTSLAGPEGARIFAGNALPAGARPIAQAYAGHQFGGFTMLGDGRAILLGEQLTPVGRALRHPVQRGGADAVLAARRRPRRARADAPRIHHQRGDARARHPDDAQPRGRHDRRAGLPRGGAARRGPDARGRQPHPGRDVRVGRRARGREALRALADYAIAPPLPGTRRHAEQPYLALLDAVIDRQARWSPGGSWSGSSTA